MYLKLLEMFVSNSLLVKFEAIIYFQQDNAKINTFNWSRVRKLSFKKKRFLVKLKPESNSEVSHDNIENLTIFHFALYSYLGFSNTAYVLCNFLIFFVVNVVRQ